MNIRERIEIIKNIIYLIIIFIGVPLSIYGISITISQYSKEQYKNTHIVDNIEYELPVKCLNNVLYYYSADLFVSYLYPVLDINNNIIICKVD